METEIIDVLEGYIEASGEIVPDISVLSLLVGFVIEKYQERRNYPDSFTDAMIESDMKKRKSTLTMAAIELWTKSGAEGQVAHSENGMQRTWEKAYLSSSVFDGIIGYAKCL